VTGPSLILGDDGESGENEEISTGGGEIGIESFNLCLLPAVVVIDAEDEEDVRKVDGTS
jgi:hypothetical protein